MTDYVNPSADWGTPYDDAINPDASHGEDHAEEAGEKHTESHDEGAGADHDGEDSDGEH